MMALTNCLERLAQDRIERGERPQSKKIKDVIEAVAIVAAIILAGVAVGAGIGLASGSAVILLRGASLISLGTAAAVGGVIGFGGSIITILLTVREAKKMLEQKYSHLSVFQLLMRLKFRVIVNQILNG